MCVEAHSGVPGNDMLDMSAKKDVVKGRRLNLASVATVVGIRNYFKASWKATEVIERDREALKGVKSDQGRTLSSVRRCQRFHWRKLQVAGRAYI